MSIPRDKLTTQTAEYVIAFDQMGVASSLALLPTAGDATSLGRVAGTHGTNTPLLEGTVTNGGVTASASETARFLFAMPIEYIAGSAVTLRAHARVSVARTVSATVDFAAHESNGEGGVSSDLVTTIATSINSITWADKDFTVTPGALEPGSVVDVLITGASNDTGGASNGKVQIGKVSVVLQVKG